MELIGMEREVSAAEKVYGGAPAAIQPNPYPYGLRLCLTMEELEKLGYSELPPAGTECRIEAVACVVRCTSEDPDADGDCDYCAIELQIKELGLEEDAEETADGEGREDKVLGRAERMYQKGTQKT
jgi:hypothetical protein